MMASRMMCMCLRPMRLLPRYVPPLICWMRGGALTFDPTGPQHRKNHMTNENEQTTPEHPTADAGPVERGIEQLPPKVMGEFPGMTPLEKLEADFRRLARVARQYAGERLAREGQSCMWHSYNAKDVAYIVAAEKVRALRGMKTPNARLTAPETARTGA